MRSLPITLDMVQALGAGQEGLAVSAAAGDTRALARFELYAGMSAQMRGDLPTSAEFAMRALTRSRGTDDPGTTIPAMIQLHRLPAELAAPAGPLTALEGLLHECEAARQPQVGFYVLGALAAEGIAADELSADAGWIRRGPLVAYDYHRTRPLFPMVMVALTASRALRRGDTERAVLLRAAAASYEATLGAMSEILADYLEACAQLEREVPPQRHAQWSAPARGIGPAQAGRAALDYVAEVAAPPRPTPRARPHWLVRPRPGRSTRNRLAPRHRIPGQGFPQRRPRNH